MLIAHIALPVHLYQLFDYHLTLPAAVGSRVHVTFGSRKLVGIIVAIDDNTNYDNNNLKIVDRVIDLTSIFSDSLWQLLTWSAKYYHYPIGEVLFHALPVLLRQGQPAKRGVVKQWQVTKLGSKADMALLTGAKKQHMLLFALKAHSKADDNYSPAVYSALQKKGLIEQVLIEPKPVCWENNFSINQFDITLNPQQLSAIADITKKLNQFDTFLLDGVTGSGKTEVYLNILAEVLTQGKQALVMVPEISLTPQTISRFKQRFNAPIDILHSKLTNKERLAVWLRSKNGENAIVVGTRSAIFTPFNRLGMIIIDEEHDNSYKQQEGWRYHARNLAIFRAKIENVPIILGSATPSLETLHNAMRNRYKTLKLTRRAGESTFADQSILDLKGLALTAGLSKPLLDRITYHLNQDNQVLLFLNRRGFAPVLFCHECSWIAECPRCDRPYTYYEEQHLLSCHFCSTPRTIPTQCPKCGSTHLIPVGFGTEKIENALSHYFPNIPITRVDSNSTRKKGQLDSYLNTITSGGAHILVGTQILAKGHHFPDVTLVALIDVDSALFSTDFRAAEHFAQVYTQVSGRAGRQNKKGEVILQTYHPNHPLLTVLLTKGYHAFANEALIERKLTALPPISYHVLFRSADKNNRYAPLFLKKLFNWFKKNNDKQLLLLGPSPANPPKVAGYHRWVLLIQHTDRISLHNYLNELITDINKWTESKKVRWSIDIDPVDTQ